MKKIIALVAFSMIFISSCKEDDIGDILEVYKKITKNLPTYTHKTVDMAGLTAKGGAITGYFKGKTLKMATAEFFADTGRSYTEFFFDDDKLIYVLSEYFSYNRPYYYTEEMARANNDTVWYDDKKTVMTTNQCYFKDDEMIKWVDERGRSISDETNEFKAQQKKMYSDAKRIQKLMSEAE